VAMGVHGRRMGEGVADLGHPRGRPPMRGMREERSIGWARARGGVYVCMSCHLCPIERHT
jgi:hypothetical protein